MIREIGAALATGRIGWAVLAPTCFAEEAVSAEEVRALAKEAYIYGFPHVDSYRIQHAFIRD